MSPVLLLGAAAAGAYFLFIKKSGPPVAATSSAVDPVTKTQFVAQAVGNGTADIFTMSGTRVVRFDLATKQEIISPPGTDPNIKAAAIRAFGVLPKG
jgi:hypothetical protein